VLETLWPLKVGIRGGRLRWSVVIEDGSEDVLGFLYTSELRA